MRKLILVAASLAVSACASNDTLYEWGSYQPALVAYAKDADGVKFETELRDSIDKAEKVNRVPPGLYAELGYLLFDQGQGADAAVFFAKEKAAFPESAVLMNKLIAGSTAAGGEAQ
jgi:hypothetical protein